MIPPETKTKLFVVKWAQNKTGTFWTKKLNYIMSNTYVCIFLSLAKLRAEKWVIEYTHGK